MILIVGVGALGSRVAQLVSYDVVLCDFDIVQESNLYRQTLYTEEDLGKYKAQAASAKLPNVKKVYVTPFTAETDLTGIEVIIDGTDSLSTRLLLNDVARKNGIPLIIGTASESLGMVFPVTGSPCWQCIVRNKRSVDDCSQGVNPDIAEAVTKRQAELAKEILQGKKPQGLTIFGAHQATIQVTENQNCECCKGIYEYISRPSQLEFCPGSRKIVSRPSRPQLVDLDKLENVTESYPGAKRVKFGKCTALVHKHGLIEFENMTQEQAKKYEERIRSMLTSRNTS